MLCSQSGTNLSLIPSTKRLSRLEFGSAQLLTHISYSLLLLPTTITTLQLPPTGAINYDHLPNYYYYYYFYRLLPPTTAIYCHCLELLLTTKYH